jgi:hypothetical protein
LNEAAFDYGYGAILSSPTGLMAAAIVGHQRAASVPGNVEPVPNMNFTGGSALATFGAAQE